MRILKQHPILSIVNGFLVDLPSPANISYLWGFGSLLGLCLVVQLATGIFLAMHYAASVDLAFASVEHIMRDVNYGWLLRYAHANGASMFFICVYLHIARGLYHGSYTEPRGMVWGVGVIIFFLMMATAFIGYVLPWGQMSFWGATVITNLVSAIPVVGEDIVQWLWGGFSVGNPTLNRFFSLHYLLPFIIAALAVVHLLALHEHGSNNPIGVNSNVDKVPFHPYFSTKDVFGFMVFGLFFASFLYFAPNVLGHSDNYIPANPLVTPAHIVPEWYFLFAYAILRAIPDKLGGVLALVFSIAVLFLMPILHTCHIRTLQFRPLGRIMFWFFVSIFLLLTWIGQQPVEEPFITLSQVLCVLYFGYFLILTPLVGLLENRLLKLNW